MSTSLTGFRVPRLLFVSACCSGFLPASRGQAQAKTFQPSNCSYPAATQVFSQWKDQGYYELAPEGGFEGGGTGWT